MLPVRSSRAASSVVSHNLVAGREGCKYDSAYPAADIVVGKASAVARAVTVKSSEHRSQEPPGVYYDNYSSITTIHEAPQQPERY